MTDIWGLFTGGTLGSLLHFPVESPSDMRRNAGILSLTLNRKGHPEADETQLTRSFLQYGVSTF